MSERISNEDGYKTHVVIGETFDHKMFRTEFHTSGNSGVRLPDYYKGEKSLLSKARHQLVASICNFLVYVQNHMSVKLGHDSFKKVIIRDEDTNKEFAIYVNFWLSRSAFFEGVHARLPRKFRPKVYRCYVADNPERWFQVCIY